MYVQQQQSHCKVNNYVPMCYRVANRHIASYRVAVTLLNFKIAYLIVFILAMMTECTYVHTYVYGYYII